VNFDLPPDLDRAVSSAAGAAVAAAVFLMKRQWAMAIVMGVSGVGLGYLLGGEVGKMWGISDRLGGAIVGAVGTTATWKLIEGIHSFDAKRAGRELWLALLRKTGLKK
jgi:hypothetical protein